jgi:hypothetical protein
MATLTVRVKAIIHMGTKLGLRRRVMPMIMLVTLMRSLLATVTKPLEVYTPKL